MGIAESAIRNPQSEILATMRRLFEIVAQVPHFGRKKAQKTQNGAYGERPKSPQSLPHPFFVAPFTHLRGYSGLCLRISPPTLKCNSLAAPEELPK
jgi:hypothetical protein